MWVISAHWRWLAPSSPNPLWRAHALEKQRPPVTVAAGGREPKQCHREIRSATKRRDYRVTADTIPEECEVGTPPSPVDGRERVARRYDVRRGLWRVSGMQRVAACGRVPAGMVDQLGVHRVEGADGARGAITGLAVCGSVWACPVCSAHIRHERAADLQRGAERHQGDGGGLAMLTLTFAHEAGDALADSLDGMLKAWRRVVTGAPWKRIWAEYGVVGTVRAVEVTYGVEHGWHPHLHVLLVTDEPLTGEERATLEHRLWQRWARMCERHGLGAPSRERGARLEVCWSDAAAAYVVKLQEGAMALETLRGDLKTSKGDRWQVFDVAGAAGDGEAWAVERWHEYERATKGRRCIQWSKGLRDLWGLDDEREDQEIVEDQETSAETLLVSVEQSTWRAVCTMGWDYMLREAAAHPDGREAAIEAVETVLADALYFAKRQARGLGRRPVYADLGA